ncbi:hypothetical protein V6N11_048324 [Hibiscus sabdariffa]|uniref:Uncharacterized protein n=1 Tax=Hibiscus sabdariffa TaxID=183260 RepID=A0ABR2PVL0_9ROSI
MFSPNIFGTSPGMFESELTGRIRIDDDYDTRSGTEMDAPSGDEQDPGQRSKRKRYHRHTQRQIQEMEAFFRECPHPDDKQRKELGRELGLEPLQVKFWFQNKRTQMKAQHERHENALLKSENEKLRAENNRYKEALSNTTCPNCGGPAALGEMSFEEQHLRIENARLREEIERLSGSAAKYVGRPMNTSFPRLPGGPLNFGTQPGFVGEMYGAGGAGGDLLRSVSGPSEADKPMIIELAVAAMEEFMKMAQYGEPLWTPGENSMDALNEEEYLRIFPRGIVPKPLGLRSEASRDSAVIIMNHVNLVEILMDVNQWSRVFCDIVSRGVTLEVLSTGVAGNYNGALQVVIWVEHVEVDDRAVHSIYRPLVDSGLAFGAKRWVATLDRQCERLASSMASNIPAGDLCVITSLEGRKSMLKLAERIVTSFCTGVGASTAHAWTTLSKTGSDDVRVMTRKSIDDPGRPPGIVLCAATSFWIPVTPKRAFEFLRDENSRSQWDILSNGGLVEEMAHIANGRDPGNCVSLLRVNSGNSNQTNMLILQESCNDATGSYVIYAPVDIMAMNVVLGGGDPDYVALLPSGFAILPDGPGLNEEGIVEIGSGGSLLTVAFQILVDSVPTSKLAVGSVTTVSSLIKCTVERIKAAVTRDKV